MNNMKLERFIYSVVIMIFLIGLVSFAIANYMGAQENKVLLEELNNNEAILITTQEELATAENNLLAANNKSVILQKELNAANEIISARNGEIYFIDCEVTEYEISLLAKTVWGEARGCNKMEQSAVVWCVLNRVDAGWGSIAEVVTAPNQFHGYHSNFPVTDEIRLLVEDVVARWKLEKVTCGDVGRTLPNNYLYFSADSTGIGNVFRTNWSGSYEVWNWDCWNPYS